MGLQQFDGGQPSGSGRERREEHKDNPEFAAMDMLLTGAISMLREQAVRTILEERKLGEPGPEFEQFKKMVGDLFEPGNERFGTLVMSRFAFLHAGSVQMLGYDTVIDPGGMDYEDPDKH